MGRIITIGLLAGLFAHSEGQIKKVLVTNYIYGAVHNEGRRVNQELLKIIADEMKFTIDVVDSESKITANLLKDYDLVVWDNMSQNGLQSSSVKRVWEDYVNGGGGIFGLHAAGDTRTGTWTWYMEGVLDANYDGHSAVEKADAWIHSDAIAPSGEFHPVLKDQKKHFQEVAITGEPGKRWANVFTDEWYKFPKNPDYKKPDLTVLLELDEFNKRKLTNWDPKITKTGYHPMAWARHDIGPGKGRVLWSGTGHDGKIHQSRGQGIKDLFKNGIIWVAKQTAGCTNPMASNHNPWVDLDDGSCLGVGVNILAPAPQRITNASGHFIANGLSIWPLENGRLTDAAGRSIKIIQP